MSAPTPPIQIPVGDPLDYGNRPGDGPLRQFGQAPPRTMAVDNPRDLPSTPSPSAAAQLKVVAMIRDVQGGTRRLHEKGPTYLPQAPGEGSKNYLIRLHRSVLFNVFTHTLQALAGFVFRKDPKMGDDVPAVIQEHAENIDNAGTHIDVFARDLLADALATGHCAILVDFPKTGGAQTAADEGPDGLRPYWVPIKKDNILSWRTTVEAGHLMLQQVVLREATYVPDGLFGEKEQIQYRVLYREGEGADAVVGFRLIQIAENNKAIIVVDEGIYGNQIEIPLVEIVSSGRRSLFESDPPLLDLCYLNIAHYQQWSDYATAIHLTNSPLLTIAGQDQISTDSDGARQELIIGPHSVIASSNPQLKVAYVSHNGQSLGSSKEALDDLVQNMAVLGVAMLVTTHRQVQTAEAKRIDKGSFDSSLSVTARGLQDGLERALDFHARYLKLPDGGSIEVNRDFENMMMDSQLLAAYAQAVAQAGIPVRLLLEAMQEGGLISDDENLENLEAEVLANAAADQARQEAENALKLKVANANGAVGSGAGGDAAPPPQGAASGPAAGEGPDGRPVGNEGFKAAA